LSKKYHSDTEVLLEKYNQSEADNQKLAQEVKYFHIFILSDSGVTHKARPEQE